MGFEIGGNTARLVFEEGTALDGATVRVSLDMSVRDFLAMQRTIAGLSSANPEDLADDMLDRWESAYRTFGDRALVSWDVIFEGEPLPATGEGVLSLPFQVANELFSAWGKAIGRVSPNSGAASANGDRSGAAPEATAV